MRISFELAFDILLSGKFKMIMECYPADPGHCMVKTFKMAFQCPTPTTFRQYLNTILYVAHSIIVIK